ncbi:N-acetylglucosamine-6-phosphate deacetylase [Celeribacter indicus]|uniref:N-acetylglucosamine-6-phosphate deacetylase n=1 Tax=Celeribacter indicus TaxID=1208324 RepID=A0A0B5E6U1_9RHOB|nr:N-acetylglucosamine-6-phosphate deacetylase [Celeribacter indicus]AJE48711.1 N-acetylglucosamine-6-phosphate deacetylase [Celeribacter indicus]SDX12349.1 N-acetylglucosamine 6-phosphate deacetylase [Celeribacter indicus]
MTQRLAARHIWADGRFQSGLALEYDRDGVVAIAPARDGDATVELIGPALTDLQVNGSGGVMLNSDPTAETLRKIVATQRCLGTGWVMPTLITCEPEKLHLATQAALDVRGEPGFLGLHIEGPHINPARKGTHDPRYMRDFDTETRAAVTRLRAAGIPVMLTLAPEIVDPEVVREMTALGVVVSAGHSAATEAQGKEALAAGLRAFTHLFNAMPPMLSRDPGLVCAAINSDGFCGIIADGHHVAWGMLQLACRARPTSGRTFLVSDAMATVGGEDSFELYGETIRVQDGALVNGAGSLAGAHIDLATSVRNAVRHIGLPLEEAYLMAAMVPRDAMRLPRAALRPGQPLAEVIAFDAAVERVTL